MIFRSPFPQVFIPNVPLTQFVFGRAAQFSEKPALIDGISGRVLTYSEVIRKTNRLAAGLAGRGFQKGDVFAIYSSNVVEYPIVFHAVALLGGIVTTINPLWTVDELSVQLKDSGAKYIATTPDCLPKISEACDKCELREVFIMGDVSHTGSIVALEAGSDVPRIDIDPLNDVVALPYSSGTTGLPKGVMLTHHNVVANLLQIEASNHLQTDDVLVCVLPFFHIYGLVVISNEALYKGATLVVLPRYNLRQMLQAIQDYQVTFAHLAPPIVLALAKDPVIDEYDLTSLKTIFSAAAPLSESVARACTKRIGCFLKQGYGMTEASPATHMAPHDPSQNKVASVGSPVSNTECKIVSTAGAGDLGCNETGEILIRGPQVMKGYLHSPNDTAKAIDADGWLHTGDIGYADESGYFYIVDRLKELIKYKGYQVAPAELEALLLSHPSVADAAVIGLRDEEAGEIPKAFVVLKSPTDLDGILQFVADRVASYKKIRRIELLQQIPKSPSGKILRRLLAAKQ